MAMTTRERLFADRDAVCLEVATHLTAIRDAVDDAQNETNNLYPDGLTAVLQQVYDLSRYALRKLPALPVDEVEEPPAEPNPEA